MFATVCARPFAVSAPFHSWVTACPLANVQRTVQPLTAAVPACTVTSPWKPPGQAFTWAYVAVQAPAGVVGGGVVGGGLVGGGVVGGGVVGGGVVGGGVP